MPYKAIEIGRYEPLGQSHPGLIIYLLDVSYHMNEKMKAGPYTMARGWLLLKPRWNCDFRIFISQEQVNDFDWNDGKISKGQMLCLLINNSLEDYIGRQIRFSKYDPEGYYPLNSKISVYNFNDTCQPTRSINGMELNNMWGYQLAEQFKWKYLSINPNNDPNQTEIERYLNEQPTNATRWFIDPLSCSGGSHFLAAFEAAQREVDRFLKEHSELTEDGQRSYYPPQIIMLTSGKNTGPAGWPAIVGELASKAGIWIFHIGDGGPVAAQKPEIFSFEESYLSDLYYHCSFMPEIFREHNEFFSIFKISEEKPACCAFNTTLDVFNRMMRFLWS
jgi:hypothetical protein